jgi:apolipoprotein N-acyltransferase
LAPLSLATASPAYRFSLAAASGVLLALSFPKFGHPALGWIALAPLLLALTFDISLLRAFVLGLICGVLYFGGTLYWMSDVMSVYGGINPFGAGLLNAAFVAYVALFPALFAVLMRRLLISHGTSALMAAPLVWTTSELGRAYLFTGFPWVLLGYSQTAVLPIAQLASLLGVFAVSALVASVSAALVHAVVVRRSMPAVRVAVIVIAVAVWGSLRMRGDELTRIGQPIRVGLIQGNVDQAQKWDVAHSTAIFEDYLNKTRDAIARGAQLVIWPESSTPFRFEEDFAGAARIRALARDARVPIILGSDHVEWSGEGAARRADKSFNSAFLVRADGTTGGIYRKIHLVPWGEYVPLKDLLFFVGPLVEVIGTGFAPGDEATLLPVDGHPVSVAICYEVIYPDLVRRFVSGGSQLLTTITNDAWFGPTSAPQQHFEQASMRAIEEGRYLVRSANTGVSGIVDPYGRVLERTAIYQPAVVVGDARLLTVATVYARVGDVFAYASAVATLVLVLFSAARGRVQ